MVVPRWPRAAARRGRRARSRARAPRRARPGSARPRPTSTRQPTIERTCWWQNAVPARRTSIRRRRAVIAPRRCDARSSGPAARRQNEAKSCSPSRCAAPRAASRRRRAARRRASGRARIGSGRARRPAGSGSRARRREARVEAAVDRRTAQIVMAGPTIAVEPGAQCASRSARRAPLRDPSGRRRGGRPGRARGRRGRCARRRSWSTGPGPNNRDRAPSRVPCTVTWSGCRANPANGAAVVGEVDPQPRRHVGRSSRRYSSRRRPRPRTSSRSPRRALVALSPVGLVGLAVGSSSDAGRLATRATCSSSSTSNSATVLSSTSSSTAVRGRGGLRLGAAAATTAEQPARATCLGLLDDLVAGPSPRSTSSMIAMGALSPLRGPSLRMRV
jgi:hypothetical protein